MIRPQELQGLKVHIIYGETDDAEKAFNEWTSQHPEYQVEDLHSIGDGYSKIFIYYREPNTSTPSYR